MTKEIDTRDFSRPIVGDDQLKTLESEAEAVSASLVGDHTVTPRGVNPLTGSPCELRSLGAASGEGSYTERALAHVKTSTQAFGFSSGSSADFVPDPEVRTTSAGAVAVHLNQEYRGIPVFEMVRTVSFRRDGSIRHVKGDNLIVAEELETAPRFDVVSAVRRAAEHVSADDADDEEHFDQWGQRIEHTAIDLEGFEPRILASFPIPSRPTVLEGSGCGDFIRAHLTLFHQGESTRLGWDILLMMPGGVEQFAIIVGADSESAGEILYCTSTCAHAAGEGNVFTHNPGESDRSMVEFPRPLSAYPLSREEVPDGFPRDWIEDDSASGNATHARLGVSGATLEGETVDGVLTFNPEDDDGDDQKVLNIFYFCNYMHDFFELLGFDEASGCFQKVNFSGAPGGGDEVQAHAHSGAVSGVANMFTRADGLSPTMNMGLLESSNRHTAFDSDVVFHEFVHGVTNRLVGGRLNRFALRQTQSRGQGEGWSDYFALTVQNHGSEVEKVVAGDWVTGRAEGIRGFPYDGDFPDGFGDIGTGRYTRDSRPHNIGEIWCAILMETNRAVGTALGDRDGGHELCWQVVVDALKLSPSNPSFLDSRDAILEALEDLRDSGNLTEERFSQVRRAMWETFVAFGMGTGATSNGASDSGIQGDDSLPEDLQD